MEPLAESADDDLLAGLELEQISPDELGQIDGQLGTIDEAELPEVSAVELAPIEEDSLFVNDVAMSETISEPAALTLVERPDDEGELDMLEAPDWPALRRRGMRSQSLEN